MNTHEVNTVEFNGASVPPTVACYNYALYEGFELNGAEVNGQQLVAYETECSCTDSALSEGFELNGAEVNGAYLVTVAVPCAEVIEESVSASVEANFWQLNYMEEVVTPLVEFSNKSYITRTYEVNVASSGEVAAQWAGRSDTTEATATATPEVEGSRGRYDTVEDAIAYLDELVTSRGQSDTLEAVVLAYGLIAKAGDTISELLVEAVTAAAEQVLGQRTVHDTVVEQAGVGAEKQRVSIGRSDDLTEAMALLVELFATQESTTRDTIEERVVVSTEYEHLLAASAVILELVRVYAETAPTATGDAWVFNTATMATSRYSGFLATEVTNIAEEPAFVGEQGLFRFSATGSAEARVEFGLQDFGTMNLKSLRNFYVRAGGRKPLRFFTLSQVGNALKRAEYQRPTADSVVPMVYRVDLDRGERTWYWGFEIVADEDSDATIIDQQVLALISDRRF